MPIPTELNPLWTSLYNEVIGIHAYWLNYRSIFATSPEEVELLNQCAPEFFWVVQDVLLSDVQLSLAKLADPPETFGKANATLERLMRGLSADPGAPMDELTQALDEFRNRCDLIKRRRNRELAHMDLATLLQQYGYASEVPITLGPSRQEIEEALGALRNFMNLIEGHYADSSTAYEHFISNGGGEDLMRILREHCSQHRR